MSIEEIRVKNERELEEIVVKEIENIERGLTIIGNQIPIDAQTKLDVLCHDENGQLVVFKLSTSEDDMMLFEGLTALNNLNAVKHMLKFYHQNFKIKDAESPRLVLLAPSYSKNLLTIANHISGIRIDLYEWEYLKFGDNKGLRIKPIFLSKTTEEKFKSTRGERKPKHPTKAESQEASQEVTVEPVEPEPIFPTQPKTEEKKEKPKKKSLLRF